MTLIEEALEAGRGVFALLRGRRDASKHFNLTPHGLVGSFIALLIGFTLVSVVQSYGPVELSNMSLSQMLWRDVVTYAAVTATIGLILKLMNRGAQLLPYLVAGNWSGTFSSLLSAIGLLFGPTAMGTASIVLLIAAVVVEINIIRFIVGLKSWSIVALIAGQVLCVGTLSMFL